jgi:hypothetical protein
LLSLTPTIPFFCLFPFQIGILRVINKIFTQEKAAMMAKEHFGHRAMCGRECLTSFGMKRFTVYGILHFWQHRLLLLSIIR